ncbi:MAG TPA: hypothetical protein VLM39_07245 [Ignavibacteriaceae bacterium]|nr:hypothetical protein [Ignavibacteriaceae bacterium]
MFQKVFRLTNNGKNYKGKLVRDDKIVLVRLKFFQHLFSTEERFRNEFGITDLPRW